MLESSLAKVQVNVKLHFFLLVVFSLPHGLHRRLQDAGFKQAMETPAGAVCDVIYDLVSTDVATEQL